MPVATIWSAEFRMSLSVTLLKKKFQLFQPMGGVCATTSAACAPAGTGAVTVREARARTTNDIEAEMRMVGPHGNDFRGNSGPERRLDQFHWCRPHPPCGKLRNPCTSHCFLKHRPPGAESLLVLTS